MYNEKIGHFIASIRKERNLTQKELAEKLFITDKAVSKWERGLSFPDISIIQQLADILNVTVSEILNGERAVNELEKTKVSVNNALDYAKDTHRKTSTKILNISAIVYSVMTLIAILTCAICNLGISQSFTWSLIPISSIVYAWLILFSLIKLGNKGILPSLIILSIVTIPFICILDYLTGGCGELIHIGSIMSVVSIIFIWIIYIIFRVCKKRHFLAAAISFLAGIPLSVIINYILYKLINQPVFDVWDFMSFGIILIIAAVFFILDKKLNIRKA